MTDTMQQPLPGSSVSHSPQQVVSPQPPGVPPLSSTPQSSIAPVPQPPIQQAPVQPSQQPASQPIVPVQSVGPSQPAQTPQHLPPQQPPAVTPIASQSPQALVPAQTPPSSPQPLTPASSRTEEPLPPTLIGNMNKEHEPLPAIGKNEWEKVSEPEPQLTPEVAEAGVEAVSSMPVIPPAQQAVGVAPANEVTPLVIEEEVMRFPMSSIQAQSVIKKDKDIRDSLHWLATLIFREIEVAARKKKALEKIKM